MDVLAYIRSKVATGCTVDFRVLGQLVQAETVVAVKKLRFEELTAVKKAFSTSQIRLDVPANTVAVDITSLLALPGVVIYLNTGGGWFGAPANGAKRKSFEALLNAFSPPLKKSDIVQAYPERMRDPALRYMSVNFTWKHVAPDANTAHAKALQRAAEGVTNSSFLPKDSARALNDEIGRLSKAGLERCLSVWVKGQASGLQIKRKRITTILFRSSSFQKVWDLNDTDNFKSKAVYHYVYYAMTEAQDGIGWICNHYESPANLLSRSYVPAGYSELDMATLVEDWGAKPHEKKILLTALSDPFRDEDGILADYPRVYVQYS